MASDPPVPAYHRVKEALLEEVKRAGIAPDKAFTTEREICARYGVSRTTAMRALNDLVREGILVRRRGQGTFIASSDTLDRGGRTGRKVGMILSQMYGQHTMEILRGAEHICREHDYHLSVFNSMASPEIEALNLRRARKAEVDGLIVFPVEGFANLARFKELIESGLSFVMVDRYYPSLPSDVVVPDNMAAGYELTDYLISQGHRHIATIWGEVNCTSLFDRLAGYRRALNDHGLPFEPELGALRSYVLLPEEERHALLTSWLRSPRRPTACLAANSYTLITAIIDLLHLGVNLSKEIDLASMDNVSSDPLLALAAVTVELPSLDMGIEAARLLVHRMNNTIPPPARHIILPINVSLQNPLELSLRSASIADSPCVD